MFLLKNNSFEIDFWYSFTKKMKLSRCGFQIRIDFFDLKKLIRNRYFLNSIKGNELILFDWYFQFCLSVKRVEFYRCSVKSQLFLSS